MPSMFVIRHIYGLTKAVGIASAFSILVRRAAKISRPVVVRRRLGHRDKLTIRPMEPDLWAASQIFGWEDYRLSDHIVESLNVVGESWRTAGHIPIIIDGGANVGYASMYFASRFPEALILAIEPDPENFKILQNNISNYDNIKPIYGALWRDERGVELKHYSTGGWSTSTFANTNNGSIPSYRIEELLRQHPESRILILKLDIEGSERQVFEASPKSIRATPCVIVEPHDYLRVGAGCLSPLYKAIAGKEIDTLIQGDAVVLVDSSLA